jgi:hypothetical protein
MNENTSTVNPRSEAARKGARTKRINVAIAAATAALESAARGVYQRNLLSGRETWDGSSLRGSAKRNWWGRYRASREALVDRAASLCGLALVQLGDGVCVRLEGGLHRVI